MHTPSIPGSNSGGCDVAIYRCHFSICEVDVVFRGPPPEVINSTFFLLCIMAPSTLECSLLQFLTEVKGSAVEGRPQKAYEILTDKKVEIFTPDELVGAKVDKVCAPFVDIPEGTACYVCCGGGL